MADDDDYDGDDSDDADDDADTDESVDTDDTDDDSDDGCDSDDDNRASAYGRSGPAGDKNQFEKFVPSASTASLPASVSYEYLFGPIEDQGDAPACVTFATSALVQALLKKHHNIDIDISKRAVYSLAKHRYEPDQLHQGGLSEAYALQVYRDIGHVHEHDWPYGDPQPTDAELIAVVPPRLINAARDLQTFLSVEPEPDDLMAALHEHGPIVLGMSWHKEWEDVGSDGIMPEDLEGTEVNGGHCVLLVGYSKAKNAFRLRNSWGPDWGDNGYAWLPMDKAIKIDDAYVISV